VTTVSTRTAPTRRSGATTIHTASCHKHAHYCQSDHSRPQYVRLGDGRLIAIKDCTYCVREGKD
jgi:hypothetical protein